METIDDPGALEEFVEHLRSAGRFAFDTEFVSEDTFEPVLCLVQVATTERLAVIDPLRLRDLSPFWEAVVDPDLDVVVHAAGEDLRICHLQHGRLPSRILDVQVVAGMVGHGYPLSLGNLAGRVLRIGLNSQETRTDWRRRPLSPGQVEYALDDVKHLLTLADRLLAQLDALGRRDWAEAECRAFLEELGHKLHEDRWRRLPGLHQLNRRGLEVARRLFDWRTEDARASNRPLRSVLRDDLLVAIARRQPASRRDLESLRDFNKPHLVKRSAEIVAIVEEALAVPPERLPEKVERAEEWPGLSMVINLLSATLSRCCHDRKVASSLAGTSSDLKDLVQWTLDGRPADRPPALLQGWRREVCGEVLLEVLEGRRWLRIENLLDEIPIRLVEVDGPDPAA